MGYFDSSDDDSDYDDEVRLRPIATKKKKSFLDDSFVGLGSDSEDDDDSDDESFMGAFRKSQVVATKRNEDLKGKQLLLDTTEKTHPEEFSEEAQEDDLLPEEEPDERVYRETSVDWFETLARIKRNTSRSKRGAVNVMFVEPVVTEMLEFLQHEDSALSVNDENHVAEDHDDIPWYEQDYQELPWYEQPDLDEDDALTALCKKVLTAGEEGEENQKRLQEYAERVEARVIGFALKLRNRARSPSSRQKN
ncbi:expressed unknown protein [Seminavis robusta]|uniref:Uncharacterized protein n=1 Tax=Seminavis robusta TaxID=568900 RepID=A0A9N8EG90_9STRA|nr:expressed unknown protein [Seminavis robusta]|eukprot:Sro946_g223270.1 n/a (250) ;mRNA; r:21233-21982